MSAGTRILPSSPVNMAFASSDSSIVFTFAGMHPFSIDSDAVS